MTILRRTSVALAATAALLLGAAPAMAHDCANASKQAGAGSVADLYIVAFVESGVVVDEDFWVENVRENGQGNAQGGFYTAHYLVSLDGADAFQFAQHDIFVHHNLPASAREGGPGDSPCDGVGIDDVGTCLDAAVADLLGA